MRERIPVGVLAATGAVGQRFVSLLAEHPWFRVVSVTASDRSAGKRYADAVNWVIPGEIPAAVADLVVRPTDEDPGSVPLLFSALPADVAKGLEPGLVAKGYVVASNASAMRMTPDVPILVPDLNPDHVRLIEAQRRRLNTRGFGMAMANCSSTGAVFPLKALNEAFGVEAVHIVTLQAISGAGYPGVSSFDILDNIIPYISNEEDKIETEPRKMLGAVSADGTAIDFADMTISAQVHRVPVMDGHTVAMSVKLRNRASLADVREAIAAYQVAEDARDLPSMPERTMLLRDEADRPQPRRDRDTGRGMTITVGRLQPCPVFDYKLVTLSHNTLRGAAGGAILAAEYAVARGYMDEIIGEAAFAAQ
ncbi:MAG: aspartate-semialdehyde dehydrogenase [Anaerolineae bacterium]|nr:aspartate-semialdehyde dehydrogenase [Anaerolineae bacterium]